MGVVLDSTVLIAAERAGKNPRHVIEDVAAERRIMRKRFLDELLNEISVEPITLPIAFHAGKIDGRLQAKGMRVALGDLLIGTTALELGYAVATANVRHFEMIPNLMVKQVC